MLGTEHTCTRPPDRPRRFRAVWLSDVHLGFRACNAESLRARGRRPQTEEATDVERMTDSEFEQIKRKLMR